MSGNCVLSDEEGERGDVLGDADIDGDGGCTSWEGYSFRRSSKVDACTDLRLKIKDKNKLHLIGGVPHPLVQRTERIESKQEIATQTMGRRIDGGSIRCDIETRFHVE